MMKIIFLLFIYIDVIGAWAGDTRLGQLKRLKWRVMDSIERELNAGKITKGEDLEVLQYSKHRLQRTIPEYTDLSYYEEIYNQVFFLKKVRLILSDLSDRSGVQSVDDLIQYYQMMLPNR